ERLTDCLRQRPLPRPRSTGRIWSGEPRVTPPEAPDGGNLLVRIWRGAGAGNLICARIPWVPRDTMPLGCNGHALLCARRAAIEDSKRLGRQLLSCPPARPFHQHLQAGCPGILLPE